MIFNVIHVSLIAIFGTTSFITSSTNATHIRNSALSANSTRVGLHVTRSANSTNSANSTRSAKAIHSGNSRSANSTNSANSTRSAKAIHSRNSTQTENSTCRAKSTHSANSTQSAYSTQVSGVESFSKLLSLTDAICGYVNWCTVQTKPQIEYTIERCCKRCSCTLDCVRTFSCCPDLGLSEHLNGSVFTNVSLLQSFLSENADFIDNVIHDHLPVETSQNEETDIEHTATECAKAQLKDAHPNRPPGSAYFMVTSCLNESVEARVRSMCESEYMHKDGLVYKENYQRKLLDVVPVQSQKTGMIYRNRHCLDCSFEKQVPFVVWNLLIATFSSHGTTYGIATSFEEIVSYFMSERYVQFFFEPDNSLRGAVSPQLCQTVDVKACDTKNENTDPITEVTCQRYVLPVYSMVNGITMAYNNLACVYCGDTTAMDGCWGFYRWEQSRMRYIPFFGALATEAYASLLQRNTAGNTGSMDNILNKTFSSNCTAGFVYDNVFDTCRRVYCPCGMVIHNSSCVPILRTVDAEYEISVKFSPLVEPNDDIEEALLLYMHRTVESSETFIISSIHMYKATGQKDQDHIAVLSFFTREPVGYVKLVSTAGMWFNGMKQIAVGVNKTINIKMAIVDSYYDKFVMYGGGSRKTFEPSLKQNFKNYNETRTTFYIYKCRFCYQMEAKQTEVELLGALVRVKRTNVYLPKQSLSRMLANRTRKGLCSEHLLGQQNAMDVSDDNSAAPINRSQDDDTDGSVRSDERFAIAMPAVIGFIILVMCLLRAARKRRTLSEPARDQIELESIPSYSTRHD